MTSFLSVEGLKHRYEEQKKKREARKNQHHTEVKEVQLRPRTDDHDFETKLKRARKFLKAGNVVRVVMRYRGRELRRPEVGVATLEKMLEATADLAKVEHVSKRIEGRRLLAVLEPTSPTTPTTVRGVAPSDPAGQRNR